MKKGIAVTVLLAFLLGSILPVGAKASSQSDIDASESASNTLLYAGVAIVAAVTVLFIVRDSRDRALSDQRNMSTTPLSFGNEKHVMLYAEASGVGVRF